MGWETLLWDVIKRSYEKIKQNYENQHDKWTKKTLNRLKTLEKKKKKFLQVQTGPFHGRIGQGRLGLGVSQV